MTRIVYLLATLAAIAALAGGGAVNTSSATNDQTCPALDTGHIDGGNNTSVTITAPAGQLITAYCVKAGSDNQGDGPVTVTVDPPAASVTITHPSGKELSHYSVQYGPKPEPVPLLTGATFAEATCTTGPSFQFVRTFIAGLGNRPFYLVDGPLVGGMPVAGQTYTITAQTVVGFILTGQTVWTHTFAAAPTNCGSTPPPPPTTTTPPPPPVTTTPGPRCPPGMTPTAGKDGKPGNDECEFPPAPPAPPAPVTTTTTPVVPAATPPPPPAVTPPASTPAQPAAGTPAKAKQPKAPAKPTKPKAAKPQPKGSPPPKPKNKPCPPGTREHNGTCNAIIQGNG